MILLLQYTLIFASVLLLVALGGCFSEHSGIINIGLEGIMVLGALGGALTMKFLPADTPALAMVLLVILGTLPLFLILPIKDKVEQLYNNTYFIAFALLATGCLLYLSDRLAKGRKNEKNATIVDVLLVGVSQAIATVPGLSRSGTTIAAGLMRGFDRTFAVRYSFLLSLPAVLGANILSLKDAIQTGIDWSLLPIYLVGTAIAAVVGYFAIRLVNLLTDKGKFGNFAYYCWGVGVLALILSILL